MPSRGSTRSRRRATAAVRGGRCDTTSAGRSASAREAMTAFEGITGTVACTLGAGDLQRQRERWDALLARSAVGREETDDGIRLLFKQAPDVEQELRDL